MDADELQQQLFAVDSAVLQDFILDIDRLFLNCRTQ
jgi:hypothetical protein